MGITEWRKINYVWGNGELKSKLAEFIETFAELPYSADTKIPVRATSFLRPNASVVQYKGKDGKPSFSQIADPISMNELVAWQIANRSDQHINIHYEVICEHLPSKVAFDLDVKSKDVIPLLPSPEHCYLEDVFLDWIVPDLLGLLSSIASDCTLTPKDLFISSSCKPYRAEMRDSYVHEGGRLSFHVAIPCLHFANQDARNWFKYELKHAMAAKYGKILDITVYDKNRNMRMLGNRKFFGPTLMPYSGGGKYGDSPALDNINWWELPMETRLQHSWVFVDMATSREIASAPHMEQHTRRLRTIGKAARVVLNLDSRALFDSVWRVYESFCETHALPVPMVEYGGDDSVSTDEGKISFYCRALGDRVCPMKITHDSNNFYLIVDSSQVFYSCLGASRPGDLVICDADGEPTTRRVSKYLCNGGKCCHVFVGELPYQLFRVPTDIERAPRIDANGIGREDVITLATIEQVRLLVANKTQTPIEEVYGAVMVVRSSYGAGKTQVASELIVTVLNQALSKGRVLNDVLIGYASASVTTVESASADIAARVKAQIPDWPGFVYYKSATGSLNHMNVAFCTQSAARCGSTRFALLIFDELDGSLVQMDGLGDTEHVLNTNLELAASAKYVLALDANADTRVRDFFLEAGRHPVFLDTPQCTPFTGTTARLEAYIDATTFAVSPAFALCKAVDAILAHDGHVAVGCTWARDVKALKQLLEEHRSRLNVMICYSGEDVAYNSKFLETFRSAGPLRRKTVFIYSPKVSEGVSNTTCKLALYLVRCSGHGPNIQKMLQAMMRARCATDRIVFAMDNEVVFSRIPFVNILPEPVLIPTDSAGLTIFNSGSAVTRAKYLRYLEMRRTIFGFTETIDFNTLDTVLVAGKNHTAQRLVLSAPRKPPSSRELEDNIVRLRAVTMTIASELAGVNASFQECMNAAHAIAFGDEPSPRLKLRLSVAEEAKNRSSNFLPFLDKTVARLGIGFTKHVDMISQADAKLARDKVKTAFLLFNIDIILAEINFYIINIKGREEYEGQAFADDMLTLCATYKDRRGDSGTLKGDVDFLKNLFDEEEIAAISTYDDVWSTHVVKQFQKNHDANAGDDDDAPIQTPEDSLHHHLYTKFWRATRAFTERNFALKIDEIRRFLDAYKQDPTCLNMGRALQAVGKYTRMFNHLWQEKFVALCRFYEICNFEERTPEAAYDEARRLLLRTGSKVEQKFGNDLARIGILNRALVIMGADGVVACPEPRPLPKIVLGRGPLEQALKHHPPGASKLSDEEKVTIERVATELPALMASNDAKIVSGELKYNGHQNPEKRVNSLLSACASPNLLQIRDNQSKDLKRFVVIKDEIFDARWYGDHIARRFQQWYLFLVAITTTEAELDKKRKEGKIKDFETAAKDTIRRLKTTSSVAKRKLMKFLAEGQDDAADGSEGSLPQSPDGDDTIRQVIDL